MEVLLIIISALETAENFLYSNQTNVNIRERIANILGDSENNERKNDAMFSWNSSDATGWKTPRIQSIGELRRFHVNPAGFVSYEWRANRVC